MSEGYALYCWLMAEKLKGNRERAGPLICCVRAKNVGRRRQSGGAKGAVTHKMDNASAAQQESAWGGLDLLPEVGGYVDDNVDYNRNNTVDTKYSVWGDRAGQLWRRESFPNYPRTGGIGSYGRGDDKQAA